MYQRTFSITLFSGDLGLALQAQLKDSAGANSGAAVTAGFAELGNGQYTFTANLADDFSGSVCVAKQSAPAVILAAEAINPRSLPATAYVAPDNATIAAAASGIAAVAGAVAALPAPDNAKIASTAIAVTALAGAVAALPAPDNAKIVSTATAVTALAAAVGDITPLDATATAEAVQAALTTQGYTTGRAAAIDHLDLDVSAAGGATWSDAEQAQIRDALGIDGEKTPAAGGQLQAVAAKAAMIGSADVTFVSPISPDGTLVLVAGDDYLLSDGKGLAWRVANWAGPSLAGATMELVLITQAAYEAGDATACLTAPGTVTMEGADALFTAEIPGERTEGLLTSPPQTFFNYIYQVRVTTGLANRLTVVTNSVHVQPGSE